MHHCTPVLVAKLGPTTGWCAGLMAAGQQSPQAVQACGSDLKNLYTMHPSQKPPKPSSKCMRTCRCTAASSVLWLDLTVHWKAARFSRSCVPITETHILIFSNLFCRLAHKPSEHTVHMLPLVPCHSTKNAFLTCSQAVKLLCPCMLTSPDGLSH